VSCAVALANIDLMEREGLNERVRSLEGKFRGQLETLLDYPLVTEVRGMGYFYALELSKDGEPLSTKERSWLMQEFLSRRLPELGLYCRLDSSAEPVITLAPPLIAGPAEFEEISGILRQGLEEAWKHLRQGKLEIDDPDTKRMPPATA
jgi:adenosylmethionine-8-amino-7-oxononanoate aminotransferase